MSCVKTTSCHYVNNHWTTSKVISFTAVNKQRAIWKHTKTSHKAKNLICINQGTKDHIFRLASINYKSTYKHQVWWKSFQSHTHEHRLFAEKINLQKSYHWQSYLFSVEEGSVTSLTWLELMQASSKENCRCFCFLEHWKFLPLTCDVIFKQFLKTHSPS